MPRILGVIPAHLESTRLRRKLLLPLCGHPLILWVYHRARQSSCFDELLVATDSEEILELCRSRDVPVMMTSDAHRSGSDRVFEVLDRGLLAHGSDDVYVNIQGDEPMITAEHIDMLVRPFQMGKAGEVQVSTLKVAMSVDDAADPNNVKVVTDARGRALYFSRAAIPYHRDAVGPQYFKHLGMYAYSAAALRRFHAIPPSTLEVTEGLEQLRFLENEIPVAVIETPQDTIGIDTQHDLDKVEELFRRGRVTLPRAE